MWRDHIERVTAPRLPGPSPWRVCSRPTCRLAYRSINFSDPGPCPMCGQNYIPAAHGPRLTQAQQEAMR